MPLTRRRIKQLNCRQVFLPHLPRSVAWAILGKALAAIYRCTDPDNPAYKNYGGRGITVCREWVENHKLFAEYIASLPGGEDASLFLDRIDNERGYEPGNLRMVTRSESARNCRRRGGGKDQMFIGRVCGNRRVVEGPIENPKGPAYWVVECVCGERQTVRADSLRRSIECGSCRSRRRWRCVLS